MKAKTTLKAIEMPLDELGWGEGGIEEVDVKEVVVVDDVVEVFGSQSQTVVNVVKVCYQFLKKLYYFQKINILKWENC